MAYVSEFDGDVRVTGLLRANRIVGGSREDMKQEALVLYPVELPNLRIWNEYERPLPDISSSSGLTVASFSWDPNVADATFFVANRDWRVVAITARVEVAGTDGGAVTGTIKKAASGTDIASGTALHTGSIDLKGTVDTNQSLTISTTLTTLDIPSGTAIGFDLTGTPTTARGVVSVFLLPVSPDDLCITSGAFGTGIPYVTTGDVKATSGTKYARFTYVLPPEYDDGESVQIRAQAGMVTTVAGTSCVLDFEAYLCSTSGVVISGSDLVATSAQSINSTTHTTFDFDVTGTSLTRGRMLDIRMAITWIDGATGTAVIGAVSKLGLRLDIRG